MLTGFFDSAGRPRLTVTVTGGRSTAQVDALIDTGFNGDLTLPISLAVRLGLELMAQVAVELADGSVKSELVFSGSAAIGARARRVRIGLTAADDAFVGTGLLSRHRVNMDFRKGTITLT